MKHAKVEKSNSKSESVSDILDLIYRDRIRCTTLISAATYHELYTPLVIIRGLAESLLRQLDRDPHAHLLEISKEAKNLLKTLEAMSFQKPPEKLKLQNISLRAVAEQSIIFFEKTCLEKGISIRLEIDEHLQVFAEPVRLKSIIISLLENAVDSFENQKLTPLKSITIHAENSNDGVHLIISDTGTGISTENQFKIRQELAKGPAAMDLNQYLSLALAKKLADDLEINLSFFSEKEQGTSFTLSFAKNFHLSRA